MKLYVWRDCFYDYTAGLGVALANDPEEARSLIEGLAGWRPDDLAKSPEVFDTDGEAMAFFVYGGG